MVEAEGERRTGRRRPPSKQATRLMLVSALAAIGLAVVLGVLFLPTLLEFEGRPRDPFYDMEGRLEGTRQNVTVVRASNPRPFSELGLLLLEDAQRYDGPIHPDIPVGPVSYFDADRDGMLNGGDFFLVTVMPGRTYILLITLLDDPGGGGVGRIEWTS